MNRAQILWLESWIALSGIVFWLSPERLPHFRIVVACSGISLIFSFCSIYVRGIEKAAHSLASLLGFFLFTVEGLLGLTGLSHKSGILVIALLHGTAFVLAAVGKYQLRNERRPKLSVEQLTREVIEAARDKDEKKIQSLSSSEDSSGA